jgi:hypothetical protein
MYFQDCSKGTGTGTNISSSSLQIWYTGTFIISDFSNRPEKDLVLYRYHTGIRIKYV